MRFERFLMAQPKPLRAKVRAWINSWLKNPRVLLGENLKSNKTMAVGDADVVKVLTLAPADESYIVNLCPWASVACRAECLRTSGRNAFHRAKVTRVSKTALFICFRKHFFARLQQDLTNLHKRAQRGETVAVRLNNLSDIAWELVASKLFEDFPLIQFFDYTKSRDRMKGFLAGRMPANYHLSYSVDEREDTAATGLSFLRGGGVVAVVFAGHELPKKWKGFRVIDGDLSDARWIQKPGTVCGLRAKGAALKSTSGFAHAT